MRLIDADALFDKAFEVWGTEADGGETNLFMEMINNAPTITPPPNDPLTLAELREMDGEPVFLDFGDGGEWVIVRIRQGTPYLTHKDAICNHVSFALECGGKVYRRKPEGGDRNA